MLPNSLPTSVYAKYQSGSHVQGIAFDKECKYMYISFTTALVKADINGNIIGSVTGLTGHLGCIDFNDEDGKLYGSLEYKRDSIGKKIADRIGAKLADEDAFYIAVFDVDKIDRMEMDGEKDGIMKAVYLEDVIADFSHVSEKGVKHRYGCSGVDGTTLGPVFGMGKDSPYMLFVSYGIYSELDREDNDCQVILQYDWRKFSEVALPLSQQAPHHSGIKCDKKYFVYTGNTNWGVQNLEYDAYTGNYFAAVYHGKKEHFPNYPMFVIDGACPAREKELPGLNGEKGLMLKLKETELFDEKSGICGSDFLLGSTGIYSLGDGRFYISHPENLPDGLFATTVKLYRYTGGKSLFTLL